MTDLIPLAPAHFDIVAQWLSVPATNRWLSGDWRNRETTPSVLGIAVRNRRNRLFIVSHQGNLCGLIGLSEIDISDKTGMSWYLMGEERFRGQGIASEALRILVRMAFENMGLESVYAWAIETNYASLKVLRNAGFRQVGRIRRSACIDDQQLDRIYFDITSEDVA